MIHPMYQRTREPNHTHPNNSAMGMGGPQSAIPLTRDIRLLLGRGGHARRPRILRRRGGRRSSANQLDVGGAMVVLIRQPELIHGRCARRPPGAIRPRATVPRGTAALLLVVRD